MQIDILVLLVLVKILFFENEANFRLNYFDNEIKFKESFQNSFELCKI